MSQSKSYRFSFITLLAAALAGGAVAPGAGAATLTWDANGILLGTGGTGTWDTASFRWNNGLSTWPTTGTDNDAVFGGTAGTVSIAAGGVTANDLTFNTTGYVIQNNTLTLNGTTPTIDTGANNATISAGVAGSAGLVKNGSGTLTLSGTGIAYTGATTVNAGTLELLSATGFASATTVNNGATLKVSNAAAQTMNTAITLNNGATLTHNGTTANNDFWVNNSAVTVASGASVTLNESSVANTGTGYGVYLDGGLKGGGGGATVTINGGASGNAYVLRNNNSTFAGTIIVNGVKENATTLGSGLAINGATTALQNADMQVNGTLELGRAGMGWATAYVSPFSFTIGALSGSGAVVMDGASAGEAQTLIVGNTGNSGSFSGVLADHYASASTVGVLGLTKIGAGTQTLSGANIYTGNTFVNGGTLTVSGSVSGTLIRFDSAVAGTRFNATSTNSLTGTTSLAVNNANATAVLSAANNHTGATGLSAGILRLENGNALANSAFAINGDNTILQLRADTDTTFSSSGGVITGFGNNGTRTYTIDANQLTGAGSGRTLALGNFSIANGQSPTINFTGGNGYRVATGNFSSPGAYNLYLSPNSVNVDIGSATLSTAGTQDLGLYGTLATGTNTIGTITGNFAVLKNGASTWALTSANSYTGLTTISAGVLNIRNSAALGGTTNGTSVTAGGALEMQGNIAVGAETLTLNGTGVSNGGALRSVSGANSYGGAITLGSATRINADAGSLALTGVIGGAQNLTVGGAGTVILSNANTYTGTTTVDGGGILRLDLSAHNDVIKNTNTVSMKGGTLDFAGGSVGTGQTQAFGGFTVGSGTNYLTNSGYTYAPGTGTQGGIDLKTIARTGGTLEVANLVVDNGSSDANSWVRASGMVNYGVLGATVTANGGQDLVAVNSLGNLVIANSVNYLQGATVTTPQVSSIARFVANGTVIGGNTISDSSYDSAAPGGNGTSDIWLTANTDWAGMNNAYASGTTTLDIGHASAATTLRLGVNGAILANSGGSLVVGKASGSAGVGQLTAGGADNTAGTVQTNTTTAITLNSLIVNNGSGAVGLTTSGTGTTTLTNANTYTGVTTVAGGILSLQNANALQNTSAVTFTGGTLQYSASNTADYSAKIKNGTGPISIDTNGQAVTYASALDNSNTGGLAKLGNGTLTLSGQNAYTGLTSVGAGTLAVTIPAGNSGASLYTGGFSVASGAALTLGLSNVGFTTGLQLGTVTLNGGTLNLDTTNAASLFRGTTFTGAGTINKTGSGEVVLNWNGTPLNSFAGLSGTFNINAGSVQFNNAANTFGTGLTDLSQVDFNLSASGTRLNVVRGVLNIGALNGVAGSTVDNTAGGGAQTLTVGNNNGSGTFAGVIAGGATIALTKNGTGTQILSGANTYTGATLISAGTLQLGNGGATGSLSASSAITTHGTLAFNRNNTLTQGTNFANGIGGTGGLSQIGAGTTTLTSANTYSGATTVNAGILEVTTNNALGATGTGTTVNAGGTLKLTGVNYATAEALSLNGTGAGGAGALLNSGTSTYAGAVTVASNATINNGGGTLTLTGGVVKNGTTVTFTGTGGKTVISGTGISGASSNSDLVVSGTTLVVNAASNYNGPTTVQNGGTLAGTGPIITTQVAVDTNSFITAGASEAAGVMGVMSMTSLTGAVDLDGTYLVDLNLNAGVSGTSSDGTKGDLIAVTGSVDLTNLKMQLRGVNAPLPAAGTHYAIKLLSWTGAETGAVADGANFTNHTGLTLRADQSIVRHGNAYYLVPEPASFMLLSLGSLLLLRRPSRRRGRAVA